MEKKNGEEEQNGTGAMSVSESAVQRLVSAFSEHDCLCCGPFEGDFGSPDDRILKDKIVTARKGGECHLCGQQIQPKERIRAMAAVFETVS